MKDSKGLEKGTKKLINEKMRCLDDFGICDKYDPDMKERLKQAIAAKPDRDPREVLDYYCRPIIQEKINSWV